MKTKEQVIEWFSERMAINKDAAETIIKILKSRDIYDVYVRYMSDGTCTNEEVITLDEFCEWFCGESELKSVTELSGSLVTEIAELQRQIDDRDRLLEHIFFVLNGDVTRRSIRTDIFLASQILDLLAEVMTNKTHTK